MNTPRSECALCLKHQGLGELAGPPGGYIYEDRHWMVCHAPAKIGPLGTLFIESRRHFLDFAEFDAGEQATYGIVVQRISAALKQLTRAARIYYLSTVEGVPHFHIWLVPKPPGAAERGLKYLARDDSCSEPEAATLADALRSIIKS
jgi:diadenosine tetraphosphate (Ap4A) HIT family hydrolase